MNPTMMINTVFVCLLLLLLATTPSLAIAGHPDRIPGSGRELISRLCKDSEDKEFCVASLISRPHADTATADQVGIIALTIASANASDMSYYIKNKLKIRNLEPALEDTLEDCSKNYLDAVSQLDDSLAALLAYAYSDVDTWVDAAITDAQSCNDALKSREAEDPELSRRNDEFLKLCKNALMINRILTP